MRALPTIRLLCAGLTLLTSAPFAVGAPTPCRPPPAADWDRAVRAAAASAAAGVPLTCGDLVTVLDAVVAEASIDALSAVEDDRPHVWLFDEIRGENCCAAMPSVIALGLRNAREEPVLAARLTWLLSELECDGTADPLLTLFDDISACRVGPDFADRVTLALGRNGGPAAKKRLREAWRARTTHDCDGASVIDPDILAAALVLAGDPEPLPWLLSALDQRSRRQYLPEQRVLAQGLARLPASVRSGLLSSLLARMRDRAFARGLADECVKAGCFRISPIPSLPGANATGMLGAATTADH